MVTGQTISEPPTKINVNTINQVGDLKKLKIAAYNVLPLKGSNRVLINLQFTVKNNLSGKELLISRFLLNEGTPANITVTQ